MTTFGWIVKQIPFKVRNALLFLRRWISGWSIGVLTAILVNVLTADSALTEKGIGNLWVTIKLILESRPPVFFLSAAAIAALLLIFPGEYLLSQYCRRRQWDYSLSRLSQRRTALSIAPFAGATISWDENLTLQLCPDISRGWPIRAAEIQIVRGFFQMESPYKAEYNVFLTNNASKDFVKNNNRVYGLVHNPTSFTDSPKLTLQVKQCWYAETRFVNEVISKNAVRKSAVIKAIATDLKSIVPNRLAAHIVVVTDDEKFVATQASKKKEYSDVHDTWSYSIEEGLIEADLDGRPTDCRVLHWIRRALAEELGVLEEDCEEDGIKLLAVFLEAHNLNSGVVAIVRLGLRSQTLRDRLGSVPRPDTEALDVKFVSVDDAIRTLAFSPENLHPTSAYRLFLALCHLLTPPEVGRRLQSIL